MNRYVIACSTPWFMSLQKSATFSAFDFTYIQDKAGLTLDALEKIKPRYIFFPHWNWLVPKDIFDRYECVCFHSAPVPYGRGGSPIQNMIVRGHNNTKVTALQMMEELDAGPVYRQHDMSLAGSGDEIYARVAALIENMIVDIISTTPKPVPQEGDVTPFKRRTSDQSILPTEGELKQIYDHIRMLDAETYPHAFIEHGDFILELTQAIQHSDTVEARVVIHRRKDMQK